MTLWLHRTPGGKATRSSQLSGCTSPCWSLWARAAEQQMVEWCPEMDHWLQPASVRRYTKLLPRSWVAPECKKSSCKLAAEPHSLFTVAVLAAWLLVADTPSLAHPGGRKLMLSNSLAWFSSHHQRGQRIQLSSKTPRTPKISIHKKSYQRLIEWLGLGGTSKIQLPSHEQGSWPLTISGTLPRVPSSQAFSILTSLKKAWGPLHLHWPKSWVSACCQKYWHEDVFMCCMSRLFFFLHKSWWVFWSKPPPPGLAFMIGPVETLPSWNAFCWAQRLKVLLDLDLDFGPKASIEQETEAARITPITKD